MITSKFLEKYYELTQTEFFVKYQKDFALNLQKGLTDGYNQKLNEPDIVKIIENVINSLNVLSTSSNGFNISTRSIFIHGNKSQVEFDYYGQREQRELGDLIFILAVIYNGEKYFEKITISQFKKDKEDKKKNLTWDLSNKEQLYLLSRFPSFKGIKGSIIPAKECNLPNYSGCLGSYNLLFRPGDFVFISAPQLDSFLGNRESINIKERYHLNKTNSYFLCHSPHNSLSYVCKKLCIYYDILNRYCPFCCECFFHSEHYASNIYDFSDKYLRCHIGEPVFSKVSIYNKIAFNFFQEIISNIKRKYSSSDKEFINFMTEFDKYPYKSNNGDNKTNGPENPEFYYEGGGIGIIYTSVNLGENN